MKKFHSGVNIIKHIYGELVYAFLEQKLFFQTYFYTKIWLKLVKITHKTVQ